MQRLFDLNRDYIKTLSLLSDLFQMCGYVGGVLKQTLLFLIIMYIYMTIQSWILCLE